MAQAGDHHPVDFHRGEMPVKDQSSTYRLFNDMVHWTATGVAALVAFLTLFLCAHAGFFASLIVAVVIIAVGVLYNRKSEHSGPGSV